MMITGRQIRGARHLFGWNRAALAGMAELPLVVVERAESVDGIPGVTLVQCRTLKATLEAAGIDFHGTGAVTLGEPRTPSSAE